jgi:hypothetical protein
MAKVLGHVLIVRTAGVPVWLSLVVRVDGGEIDKVHML